MIGKYTSSWREVNQGVSPVQLVVRSSASRRLLRACPGWGVVGRPIDRDLPTGEREPTTRLGTAAYSLFFVLYLPFTEEAQGGAIQLLSTLHKQDDMQIGCVIVVVLPLVVSVQQRQSKLVTGRLDCLKQIEGGRRVLQIA